MLVVSVLLFGWVNAYLCLRWMHAHEMRHWKKKLSVDCAQEISMDPKLLEMVT